MKILERPDGSRVGCSSLRSIGYGLFEVNLEGEVYKYGIPSTSKHCKVERVGNRCKIKKYDRSGRLIERVMRTDVLVGCAWYNIDESLWENSIYADTIRRCKEFFSISIWDKAITDYQTKNGFSYCVTKYGEVWNTETMNKVNGSVDNHGYRHVDLGSVRNVSVHRLVAHHFVRIPDDLLAQGLTEETLVVNHIDGDKLNNRWDNLEWVTQKGNVEHASINGLMHTTIDNHLLECVWQYLEAGYSDINISRKTGVPAAIVNCIRRGTSLRYRTDKYTWSKHSPRFRVLDKDIIFSIYDKFMYTDKSNSEIGRQYNVDRSHISKLRTGHRCSKLACEYINLKGLDRNWKGYNPPK